jgi:hypothetical protein
LQITAESAFSESVASAFQTIKWTVQTFTVQCLQQLKSDICYTWLCCHIDGSHLATYHLFGPMKQHFRGYQLSIPLFNHSGLFGCWKSSLTAALGKYCHVRDCHHDCSTIFVFLVVAKTSHVETLSMFSLLHGILVYVITLCMKSSKNQTIMEGTNIPNADSTYSTLK